MPRLFWPYFDESDNLSVEDFYRRALMLFKPWRSESELKQPDQTHEQAFDEFFNATNFEKEALDDIKMFM